MSQPQYLTSGGEEQQGLDAGAEITADASAEAPSAPEKKPWFKQPAVYVVAGIAVYLFMADKKKKAASSAVTK